MIVKMSKVEIAGPKDVLNDALEHIQDAGIFHLEKYPAGFVEKDRTRLIKSRILDKNAVAERLFLDYLKGRIDELFSYLPDVPAGETYIDPRSVIDSISETIKKHIETCRELFQKREALIKERIELDKYGIFLDVLSELFEKVKDIPDLDFIGLTIRDEKVVGSLRELLNRMTEGRFELYTISAADGTLVGLIATQRGLSEKVRRALSQEQVPEFTFPPAVTKLSFPEKIAFIKQRVVNIAAQIGTLGGELERFAVQWKTLYLSVKKWIDERIAVMQLSSCVFETEMCFIIYGWIPAENVEALREKLNSKFEQKVVMDQLEITEHDLNNVPVIIKNPAYFRPFEIFSQLLPLPKYASYDPTPFIGIFFPLFFGMILGDAGYGLFLLLVAAGMMLKAKKEMIRNVAKILLVCSIYTMIFGVVFGEFFGEHEFMRRALERWIHVIDRKAAIMPMLFFALAVGFVHVMIGFLMGLINALKQKMRKEAVLKLVSILMVAGIIMVVASFAGYIPHILTKPVIFAVLFLLPFLLLTGGIIAPLEILKSIGNIISYARIMAIGLTSVLLAYVANSFAGPAGDVVIGIIAATLLHLLNILLGVFSPTIHALRLHYVEFFSKFLEYGGKKYEPLHKGKE